MDAPWGAADPQQSKGAHDDHDGTGEGEEHAHILEGEHAVQLGVVAKADVGDGVAEGEAGDDVGQQYRASGAHQTTFHSRNDTATAVPKNTAVATRLTGRRRPQPLSPWPEL